MEEGNAEDGSGDIVGSQDSSTNSATTRDLRLDDWIIYQHDQIQRNADILKDDLETVRKRCMVPDLPKLVKENKSAVKLSKSIVNQFQGVIQKHIDVMGKLSLDMSLELHDRFSNECNETITAPLLALLPAVSPPSSTTADLEGLPVKPEDQPDNSASDIETARNVNQSMSPVLVRKNSTRTVDLPKDSSSFTFTDETDTDAGMQMGNESDCSNCSANSGATVLMQRTTTQKIAKKTFSPVKVEKPEKEKKRTQKIPTIDEMLDMELSGFSAPPTTIAQPPDTAKENGGDANNATKPITDNELRAETDLSVPPLLRCPKLTQTTKVVLHKLPRNALAKLGKKNGRIAATELDDLDRDMAKLIKYNAYLKPAVNGKKKKPNSRRARRTKKNTEDSKDKDDSNEEGDLSDGTEFSDLDSAEISLMTMPPKTLPMQDQEYESEYYSDMDDLSGASGADAAEGEKENGAKKKATATTSQAPKSRKKYITPKVVMPISSDDEEALKTKVKKEKSDTDGEKRALRSKKNSAPETVDEDKSGNDKAEQATDENKPKGSTDSDSDSDFTHFKNRRIQSILDGKKAKKFVRSDDSEDSDFVPTAVKRLSPRKKTESEENTCSDSEVDGIPLHKKPRKKRVLTSASESDSSTKKTKKRRRIKKEDLSESEMNDSDVMVVEPEKAADPSPKKGMRKVMSKKELQKTTRQAGKDEEERKKRVTENQKLYNQLFSSQLEKGERLTELVLDFDKTTKKALLSVDPTIVKQLKPHQVGGIKFMFETCYESVETIKSKDGAGGGGCILAHCMGLGKTLQTIGFLHTVMSSPVCKTKYALVICPLNTVGNWYNEFQQWCSDCDVRPRVHKLWDAKGKRRFEALSDWQRMGGVGIIHYESFRLLASSDEKKTGRPTQKELKIVETCLLNPGPDIVVCDEGHLLKNASTKQAQAVMKIRTPRRVVLTGTPLQNDLMEYHTMMSFVKPNLLGTKKEFRNRFVNPIERGQSKSSDTSAVSTMKKRAHVLHKLLDGCVQRLDYSVLTPYLPPKFEYAITINLSQVQKDLYQHYIDNVSSKATGPRLQLLPDYQALVKVWTHPVVLTYKRRNQMSSESETGSLKDFICDETTSDSEVTEVEDADSDVEIIDKKKDKNDDDISVPPSPVGNWYSEILRSHEDLDKNIELSGKILVLFEILKTCALIEDKVLVFSQFLTSLDLIEEFLAQLDYEAQQKAKDEPMTFPPSTTANKGRWRPNIEYYRIDGSTKTEDRQKSCKIFNQEKATRAKLFLISTKAGGLGINLTGANRVVMFDASWNPSHDIQSIFRVFRFGQTKPCYIYRLLARGTMEEKIYNRQVVKLSLSCRVVDEQQIERHFQYDEVQEMYNFNPNDTTARPIPAVPKDRLLADLLISHEKWIFSYLEHDSLLENKEEEELTEDERKAAWEEYNNEEKPKLTYTPDAWTSTMSDSIKERFPEKSDMEIFQIVHKTRLDFDYMEQLISAIQGATSEAEKMALNKALSTKATELKTIFGDDTDWTGIFQARREHNVRQQQVQQQRQQQQQRLQHQQLLRQHQMQMQQQQQQRLQQQSQLNRVNSSNKPNYQSQQPASSASFNKVHDPRAIGADFAAAARRAAAMKKISAAAANDPMHRSILSQSQGAQSQKMPALSVSQRSGAGFSGGTRNYPLMGRDPSIAFHNGEPLSNQPRPTPGASGNSEQQRLPPVLTPVGFPPARPTTSPEAESILPDLVDLD